MEKAAESPTSGREVRDLPQPGGAGGLATAEAPAAPTAPAPMAAPAPLEADAAAGLAPEEEAGGPGDSAPASSAGVASGREQARQTLQHSLEGEGAHSQGSRGDDAGRSGAARGPQRRLPTAPLATPRRLLTPPPPLLPAAPPAAAQQLSWARRAWRQ
jgi:hypothetical protein